MRSSKYLSFLMAHQISHILSVAITLPDVNPKWFMQQVAGWYQVPGLTDQNKTRHDAARTKQWGGVRIELVRMEEETCLEPKTKEAFVDRKLFCK